MNDKIHTLLLELIKKHVKGIVKILRDGFLSLIQE